MITKEAVAQQLWGYLNGRLSEAELVAWAEASFVQLSESDADMPDEALLLDILGYIGAGDTPDFPLTWAILSDFLAQLGVRVRVIAET
ncbi:MAG: hypothetical protein CUN51_05845 [Candidatus Thermofonsia Clade 1 bacterium]|uniref:Uncharacterized protein n=1 Tax=Candidatus Thermofonsia Clade 1 bacterium TaxID=2364210 RepID=A0A2M8P0C4_9CHLR|nr:MAG: hypothetical protein CUN51_05845 [Candidatus Thermofonsia Clade 1 bacterium]